MSTTSRYNEFPAFLKRYFPYKVQKISLNARFSLVPIVTEIKDMAVVSLLQ